MNHIDIGKKEGATVHLGGERHGTEGFFIQPTIFTNTKPEMTIIKEEIFGPVVAVAKFSDVEELIKAANDTTYGLAAGVFTKDISRAIEITNRLKAGTVWVNCYNILDTNVPFGGFKRELSSSSSVSLIDGFLLGYREWYGTRAWRVRLSELYRGQSCPYQPQCSSSDLKNVLYAVALLVSVNLCLVLSLFLLLSHHQAFELV